MVSNGPSAPEESYINMVTFTVTTPSPKPTTFAPGDVLQRGRVRYVLLTEPSGSGGMLARELRRRWWSGRWTDDEMYAQTVWPHMLVNDGWTHTPGPNNPQAGEVK